MSEETACEHRSPSLQANAKEPLMADKVEATIQDIAKKSSELPTALALCSRSDFSLSENSGNIPNSDESGEELSKVTKEPTPVLEGKHNDEKLIEGNVSSSAIKMKTENEKRPQLKALETRSQYHSIQQLSSPSTKWNKSVNCTPQISYKISDIVSPSRYYGKSGKQSFISSSCENMESATQSSEDEDETHRGTRYSGKLLHNEQVIDYGWRAPKSRRPVHEGNQCEFSDDEEEEFLQSSIHCGSESLEEMSDMEMSDGGSRSHYGSVGEVQQREALPNVDESSQGLDAVDEFMLTDVGFEGRMEAKRARVENIIKTMTPLHKGALHSFPICQSFSAVRQLPENRDKEFSPSSVQDQAAELRRPKRKQYIPQQVDPRGEQHVLQPAVKVCVMERDAVGNELLKMQEGLTEQMPDCDHEESFNFSDQEDSKDNNEERSAEKTHGLSDVNQNDVKSVSREFFQAFSNGGEWMLDMANENTKDLGLKGSVTSLEHLAEILKTQITSGVERLIDNFLKTYLRKCFHSTSRDGAKNTEMMSPKVAGPVSARKEGFARYDLKQKDELIKEDSHMKDEGVGQQRRGELSVAESKVKEDISGSEKHAQDNFRIATNQTRDNSNFPERKRKASTPLTFTAPRYHATSRNGVDTSSHLTILPPPLTMQPTFPIHNSISDGTRSSISCERNKTAEKCREHYFDTLSGGAFGIPQSHMSLFGPHHPHLYYSPCIGKFPPAFVREQEQMEPLPLIVGAPKKPKRTKVIDRVSPRAIRSVPQETATQGDDGSRQLQDSPGKSFHPAPRYHPAGPVHDAFPHPSLLPFSLTPSVALHNPSLQQHSTLLQAMYSQMPSINHREKPSSLSSPSRKTPPYSSSSDLAGAPKSFQKCESDASLYDQMMSDSMMTVGSSHSFTSTLTPMHLRKAKLMFFYVRYPSSAILKVYFPDVKFNKNNTAQLVKWFSNFREFYYIQMEKYARQALAEGVKSAKDLVVTTDAELYRILVVHYNRNCQIEVPENFRYVVQSTLREFYTSVVAEKDQEPSWKKAIYKVIARMDDPVPEYFKSPNWMERLADG